MPILFIARNIYVYMYMYIHLQVIWLYLGLFSIFKIIWKHVLYLQYFSHLQNRVSGWEVINQLVVFMHV